LLLTASTLVQCSAVQRSAAPLATRYIAVAGEPSFFGESSGRETPGPACCPRFLLLHLGQMPPLRALEETWRLSSWQTMLPSPLKPLGRFSIFSLFVGRSMGLCVKSHLDFYFSRTHDAALFCLPAYPYETGRNAMTTAAPLASSNRQYSNIYL
jgi:hypothetical protein